MLVPVRLFAGNTSKQLFFMQSYEPGVGCGTLIEKGLLKGLRDFRYEAGTDIDKDIDIVRLSLKARKFAVTYSPNKSFTVRMFNELQKAVGALTKEKEIALVFLLAPPSLLNDQNKLVPFSEVIYWISLNQKKPGCVCTIL